MMSRRLDASWRSVVLNIDCLHRRPFFVVPVHVNPPSSGSTPRTSRGSQRGVRGFLVPFLDAVCEERRAGPIIRWT